jgi:pimeloyl-ACP methyl ester carboxylesterase
MTLRVATAGSFSGVPVLMMHGFPESWFSWRHQLVALADAGFYAIAPDMRGCELRSAAPLLQPV